MQNTSNNTIIINGKEITLAHNNQTWWVAVKPICEALGINYKHQNLQIFNDPILGQLSCKTKTTGADGKTYEMLCLPEQFIYGWVFSLQSNSPKLQQYKLECYKALYNHFHGANAQRMQLLKQKTQAELEIEKLQAELKETDTYKKIEELKKQEKLLFKQAANIDKKLIAQQLPIWKSEMSAKGGNHE